MGTGTDSLVLKDTESATFLDSIVDIGELSASINVIALFRCKECGFSAVSLNLLTEHINSEDACKNVINNSTDVEHLDYLDVQSENLLSAVETDVDVKNAINAIVAEADTEILPVKKKRGRPRKNVDKTSQSLPVEVFGSEDIVNELPCDCVNFTCLFCKEEFTQYSQLHAHQTVHIEEKLQCKRRNKSNNSRPSRKIKCDDDSKPIACPICPMEFLTGYKILQQHFTCHMNDEKHFRCPWCEMEYKSWCRMFLHLGDHDENDFKRINGIVARHDKLEDNPPRKPIMDEDEISDNEESDENEEDVYVPSQTTLSPKSGDSPGYNRRRGRTRKYRSGVIRLAQKPADYKVMPFPGLDGVFMIGDANDDLPFRACEGTDSSVTIDETIGSVNSINETENADSKNDSAPAQTLEDLIEAIETEVKRQEEGKVDVSLSMSDQSPVKKQSFISQSESNNTIEPILETFWIDDNSDTVNPMLNDEVQPTDVKEKINPVGVLSFCPHCVLMRGCKREIEMHIKSHCPGEANFMCTLCPESMSRFDIWNDLRDHCITDHPDVAIWPTFPSTVESSFTKIDDSDDSSTPPSKKPRFKKISSVKPFRCSRCKTIYLHSSEELGLHKSCHFDGDVEGFRCTFCDQVFTAWFKAINHMVEDHRDGKRFPWQKPINTQCQICGIVKKTTRHLHDHIRTVHRKKNQYTCSICGAKFQIYQSWRRHEEGHQAAGTWACDLCGYVAKHSFSLKTHKMIKHENKGFPCPYCKYRAPQKNNLEKHVFMVHQFDGKMAVCDICGQQFKNPSSVVNHRRRKHSNNPVLRCEICGFETTDKLYLKCHMQKRHEPKKFQCSFCPYGTMQEQALQTHLRTHTEHRPYVCTYESCFFRARDQKTLTSHIRNSHTSDETTRRFKCNTCGKSFKTATILKHHIPVHTGEMPHQCFYCPFRAKHRSTIHRHVIKQHKHHQENAATSLLPVINSDETKTLIHPQALIKHLTTTEDGALIVDESTVEVVNQVAQGLNSGEETTTILVMPVGMDQVQSEVIVDSQNSAQHEAAVQILQQLMQMAESGQQTSIMSEVLQNTDSSNVETVQIESST